MLNAAEPQPDSAAGLVLTNPPYGKRMGDAGELGPLYEELGDTLKKRFPGWQAAVITGRAGTRQADGPARPQDERLL